MPVLEISRLRPGSPIPATTKPGYVVRAAAAEWDVAEVWA